MSGKWRKKEKESGRLLGFCLGSIAVPFTENRNN